jgi:branched-chain amino acid transport system substrate-binding protein
MRVSFGSIVLPVVALLLLALLTLSCPGNERAGGEPIRIAFAGPTSGPSAQDGLSAVHAIELVLERVNESGGVGGRPVVLDVYDDANDPERARSNAPSIAEQSTTLAVIGHNFSTCSIAAGEVYAARGLPAVSSAATSVAVTRDNPWYFRVIYDDRAQGRFLTAYVAEVLGGERFGIAHETDAYGAYLAEVMQATAPEVGAGVAGRWSFDPADPRLDARLAAIAREVSAASGPPVLVLAMQPEAGVALVKHLRDRGFDGELVVTDALASQAFADGFRAFPEERSRRGFYTDGIYASTPFLFDTAGRRAADFLRDYVARYDRGADWYAAFAADAAAVLVEAMRRAGLSPGPATIAEDRTKLREALAAIGPHDPVAGITGPTSFDASRNAEKPVPMGRFLNGEILSAFVQLRLLPGLRRLEDLSAAHQVDRVVKLGDRLLYRTDVARVGVRARRFGKLDFSKGSFEMDFDVWFRHQADRGVEQIEFTNAVEPISLGDPVDELVEGRLQYRLYRVRGLFRADTLDAPYGGHALALSLHHRERVRQDLVLALDTLGMNLGRASSRSERGAQARRLLGATTNWAIDDLLFFESEVDEPALGHPGYLRGTRSARPFSQLTVGVILRQQSAGLRGIVPPRYQPQLLALALAASALLLFTGRGSSRLRFLLQAAFALLLLMTAEPVLGNWLNGSVRTPQLVQLRRSFGVLWWIVPAFLVTVAIQRFVWKPAEARSGTPVPTILRYFVAFIIFALALFGVVAFVFDYRLTGLLATSGVLAMIIGLAVQLNITNIFAGVALNLERPFRVGDWIMIHGRTPDPDASVIGKVIDINWRTTRLKTADDTEIVIPNGVISEKTITNFNAPSEMSRFQLYYTVDQSVLHERVIDVIQAGVNAVIGAEKGGPLAEPPPKVRIDRVNETGIVYVVRYRILPSDVSPRQARHNINESVLRQLREAGIELAYPGRRIYEAGHTGVEVS